jgi:Xaa-Pro aminopeptidase
MGTKADLTERDMRYRRLREAMAADKLDALLLAGKGHWWTGRGYFRYLTDFHLWGHDGLILFPLAGEPMLTLTSAAVAHRIGARGWITDVKGDPDIAPAIVEEMKRRGLTEGRVGIAGYKFIMGVGTYNILTSGLPDVTFVDADMLVDRIRMVKSPLEIQQQRELWTVAKAAMARFEEALAPGHTEYELAAEAIKVAAAGGARDFLVFMGGGPPQPRPVKCEDILGYHMEMSGESGHWCELTVTTAFREPTALELKLMETELLAGQEIHKMAKPGVRISDMAKTFERVLVENGWQLTGEKGLHYDFHGQGLDAMEYPMFAPIDQRQDMVLEAGMTFSFHPRRNVAPTVRGTGINENIVITEHGAERLSGDWDMRWKVR